MNYLFHRGASDVSNQNGSTALTFAAEKARSEAVEVLIKHNADVNARTNKRGITPLIFAVKARDLKSARLLLEAGANVNARTFRTKYTALIAAVRNRDVVRDATYKLRVRGGNTLANCTPGYGAPPPTVPS